MTATPSRISIPPAGSTRRVVERSQDGRLAVQERVDVAVLPNVIARGDDVDTRLEQGIRDGDGDAPAASCVLAVSDNKAQALGAPELRQELLNRTPPGPAHYIADL